jgi:hypothetical protein
MNQFLPSDEIYDDEIYDEDFPGHDSMNPPPKPHSGFLDVLLSLVFINAIATIAFLLWIYVSEGLSVLFAIFAGVGAAAFFLERTTRLLFVCIPVFLVAGLGVYLASDYYRVAGFESADALSVRDVKDHWSAGSFSFTDGILKPEYGYCTKSHNYVQQGSVKQSVPTCTMPYVHETWTSKEPVDVWVVRRMDDTAFSFKDMAAYNTRKMVRESEGGAIPGVALSAIERHGLLPNGETGVICVRMVDSIKGEKKVLKQWLVGVIGGVEFLWIVYGLFTLLQDSKKKRAAV